MQTIQDIIHKFEVSEGQRYISIAAGVLVFITVLVLYNLREATGFASIEGMDGAQVAHNVASGKGFSTNFIRPLSLKIVGETRKDDFDDPMLLKGHHPDLANAPLYLSLLAGAMKMLPFDFEIPALHSKGFSRFQPEVIIGVINQIFFILSAVVLFRLAKRLFDDSVAWFAIAVFLGTDIMWRFCFSGLSTNLAILFLLLLVGCLLSLESRHESEDSESTEASEPRSMAFYILRAAACGLLLGSLMMTRYSLGLLIVPVIFFCALYLPGKRLLSIGVILIVFGIVVAPWLWRNHQLSGRFFGTAGYAHWQDSNRYRDNDLERTLQGELSSVSLREKIRKVLENSGNILENEIPKLGGSWLSAFFLVGLLVPFESKRLNRLRVFTLLALLTLGIAQALGTTHLSRHSPQVNSQNLIILLLPLIYAFGSGMFFLLLDQLNLNFASAQYYVSILVALLACLPLIFRMLPPQSSRVAYPPYSPPLIQQVGNWFEADELIMSDMPWAVGWYADKKCLWLTKNLDPDFYAINDAYKPINGLYLTPITTDGNFLTQMIRNSSWAWGRLHMDIYLRKNLPKGFPLLHADDRFLPDQLVLTDWPRWNTEER
ncbi:MAG: hypothetical protein M2R45_02306 [Verrucomicrobia subdivision 3 bacterium]|nr:hypothetical protein [Limisphaerales bacterium]MCS1414685.1 hypothetical protein [Limisphaerales bacterium]